jgi:hypothetical protein
MGREQKPLETVFGPVRWLQFPTMAQGRTPDFDEERDDKWQVGFYSFDGDIMQIEEGVQTCTGSGNPPLGRKLGD